MLVRPLEEQWRDAIGRVLSARRWPALSDAARLGPLVARLSEAYNIQGAAPRDLLPARLAFSFARDVPKGAASVRELVTSGLLACSEGKPLRVLDLGAGLGATTWGVARALEAAGQRGAIDATWIDADAEALRVATELVAARAAIGATGVTVRARTIAGGVSAPRGERYDLVVLGQVMSELDGDREGEERVAKHAALLRALLDGALLPSGSLVVLEPALQRRTRHLHAVRDALLAGPNAPSLFAPCLHAGACPARKTETDWCHEDLPVDLPPWLAPIARAAGLRWQGLTFSYLVLRNDGAALEKRGFAFRVVSGPIVTKGKRELFLCGKVAGGAARLRAQRIDRHASEANAAWDGLSRGDLVNLTPAPAAPAAPTAPATSRLAKVLPDTRVDVERAEEY